MSFALSKIIWALLNPATLLFLLLLLAWLLAQRRPQFSRALLGLAALFTSALVLAPLGHWLIGPLETRFPEAALPDRVDGIVVLGGAIDPRPSTEGGRIRLNSSADRITEFVALARRYPDARLLYTGGSGELRDQTFREADAAADLLATLGVDRARLLLERDSRNTWENAVNSKKLASPQPGETWLLITSASHMPRAVGCFRRAGWQSSMVPDPVDYVGGDTRWFDAEPENQLQTVTRAVKEWIGLIAYHLLERTDAWLPAPAGATVAHTENANVH